MKVVTNNFEETQKLGETFAKNLHGGDMLLLFGDLGSGKTTFMQGLARGLGIERRIISPTFIIMRSYSVKKNKSIEMFYHIDLYRTQSEDDLKGLGLQDVFENKNAIIAVEWPEKLGKFLPGKRWELHFQTVEENVRSITMKKYE